jgi:formaldehyde-activating enzyme involved in methanogenesis
MDILAGISAFGNYINNKKEVPPPKVNSGRVKREVVNGDNMYSSKNNVQNKKSMWKIAEGRYNKARETNNTGVVPNVYNDIQNVKKERQEILAGIKKKELDRKCYIEQSKTGFEGFNSSGKRPVSYSANSDNDSMFSDDNSNCSNNSRNSMKTNNSLNLENDYMAFFKKSNLLNNNNYHEKKLKQKMDYNNDGNGEPGFYAQFDDLEFDNPSDPVSQNNIPNKKGPNANISRIEMERDLALKGNFSTFTDNTDMTYGVVDDKDFIHNNMVPFFKSGIGKGYAQDSVMQQQWNDIKQRKVDTFTGSLNNPEYRPKTERRPLFNPQVGLTNIYGMPNFTDYMAPRFTPGRERRNELVHQPIRTTPGLNLNYNEVNKQGFQDSFRVLPKTVDELRAANKPKISYGGVVIPGLKTERRAIIPNVAQYKPPTFKENDVRDLVKSFGGQYVAPSIYGNFEAPSTARQQTTRAWYAPAGHDATFHKPGSMYEQVQTTHKENFKHDAPHNVAGIEQFKNTTNTANTYNVPITKRQVSEVRSYVNPAATAWNKGVAFDMVSNIPDPTMRNTTENRDWQNPAAPTQFNKGPAFDMVSNIPDPTMRNTTEKMAQYGPMKTGWNKHVAFDMQTNIPDPTIRNTTERKTQYGPMQTGWNKGVAFDMQTNIPDPTIRNTTEKMAQYGPMQTGWNKGVAFDMQTNIPDPTIRNTTERISQYGPMQTSWQKPQAFDMQTNIPDPTIRNTTERTTQYGPMQTSWQKPTAFDMQTNIPDPTIRQTTERAAQYGPMQTSWNKGVAFDMQTNIPDPTLRNATEKMAQYGPAQTGWQKHVAFDMQTNIPDPTMRQTTEKTSQYGPAQTGWQKHVAFDMQTNIPDPTMRQTTEKTGQYGPMQTSWQKHVAFDMQTNIPDPTLRNLTEIKSYQGPAITEWKKGGYIAEQAGTIAPPTLRMMTQNKTSYGPMGPGEREKGGYQVELAGTIAPPTLRQMTEIKTEVGPAAQHEGFRTRSRGDMENALMNVGREKSMIKRDGGAPTTSNYTKTPTYEHTMVQLCEPIQINRDLYGYMGGQRPNQCIGTNYTKIGKQLPQVDQFRFDNCVFSALATNPYVNNLVNKATIY